jgi:hypothetical protein
MGAAQKTWMNVAIIIGSSLWSTCIHHVDGISHIVISLRGDPDCGVRPIVVIPHGEPILFYAASTFIFLSTIERQRIIL